MSLRRFFCDLVVNLPEADSAAREEVSKVVQPRPLAVVARAASTQTEMPSLHYNQIMPQDRDTRSSSTSLAVAVIPALITAGRHCDDFML